MTAVVYVAASSSEMERAREAMQELLGAGLSISIDWTRVFRPVEELNADGRRAAANACIDAIERSDVLLLLAPSVRSDALWEAGYAHGSFGPNVHVAGPVKDRGIFAALPRIEEHETDAAAIAAIVQWAEEHGEMAW